MRRSASGPQSPSAAVSVSTCRPFFAAALLIAHTRASCSSAVKPFATEPSLDLPEVTQPNGQSSGFGFCCFACIASGGWDPLAIVAQAGGATLLHLPNRAKWLRSATLSRHTQTHSDAHTHTQLSGIFLSVLANSVLLCCCLSGTSAVRQRGAANPRDPKLKPNLGQKFGRPQPSRTKQSVSV